MALGNKVRVAALSAFAALALVVVAWAGPPVGFHGRTIQPDAIQTIETIRRIDVNNINMIVSNQGSFANDIGNAMNLGGEGLVYPKGTTKTAVYAAGPWISALVNDSLRVAVAEYSYEYGPGNILPHATGQPAYGISASHGDPWFIVYKVARWTGNPADSAHVSRTAGELAADPSLDPLAHHSWSEYMSGAAPFGAPWKYYRLPTGIPGDSVTVPGPDVSGDLMCWSVCNDADPSLHTNAAGNTPPMGLELQQTIFGYNRPGALGNTVFVRYKLINKGLNTLKQAYFSQWSDPDVGGFSDDLTGCDTLSTVPFRPRSMGYAYNSSNADQQYGATPPAIGFDFIRGPKDTLGQVLSMKSFNKYINGTDPASAQASRNYQLGLNPDGSSVVDPWGSITRYTAAGDPVSPGPQDWLDSNASDRRMMLSSGPFRMAPGDSQEVVVGLVIGQGADRLSSISSMRSNDQSASAAYDTSFSGNLVVTGAVTFPRDTIFNSVTVQAGGTLTARKLTVLTDMTVASGGIVTHALRDTAGLSLNVTGTLTVASGGSIDVSAKGLLSGGNGSAFGATGETFNSSGAIVAGATAALNGPGAGYGGVGGAYGTGRSNDAYGLLERPAQLGSGGALGTQGGTAGGNGGGRLKIVAGTCVVNGQVLANGGASSGAYYMGGGGSGGAIWMQVGSLSGTGYIKALGGSSSGPSPGGAGGGGRIAIEYGTMTLASANLLANSGASGNGGSAGTVYLKDNAQAAGDLVVNNSSVTSLLTTPLLTSLAQLRNVTVLSRGYLTVRSGATLAGPALAVSVQGNSNLTVNLGATFTPVSLQVIGNNAVVTDSTNLSFAAASNLSILNWGQLYVHGGAVLSLPAFDGTNVQLGGVWMGKGSRLDVASNVVTVNGGVTLTKDGSFGVSDSLDALTISGTVTMSARDTAGLVLKAGTMTLNYGATISVDGLGLRGGSSGSAFGARGEAFDPVTGAIVAGASGTATRGSGASYGGIGDPTPTGNAPYGLLENANLLGAGGGAAPGIPLAVGGPGGGRVRISATSFSCNWGTISAAGGQGASSGGAVGGSGSGGSIRLDVGSYSGSSNIWAPGALSANGRGGSGGGGRIAIYYNSIPASELGTSGSIHTQGGSGGTYGDTLGGAGTVYFKDRAQATGDVVVNFGGIGVGKGTQLLTLLPAFHDVSLRAGARVDLDATQRTTSWAQYITLSNATLSAPDSIRLQGTVLRGYGTVAKPLVNNGEIAPSDAVSPGAPYIGQIVCAAGYQQGATGVLRTDVSIASSTYDQLRVVGNAVLDGQLAYRAVSNTTTLPSGVPFPVVAYGSHTGTFATVTGVDSVTGVAYFDTTAAIIRNLDRTPPQTAFVTGLADSAWTNSSSLAFSWTGTDNVTLTPALRYSYRLDNGAWSALGLTTSNTFSGLTSGPHTVSVYAVDEMGNADPAPPVRHFTVDLAAPTVAFGSGPANGDTVRTELVVFTLRGSDDLAPISALKYAWSLDGAAYGSAVPDTIVSLSGLSNGPHTLAARVQDLAGNMSAVISRSWNQNPTIPVTNLKALFDNSHLETAGNADWIVDDQQPIPSPPQSGIGPNTAGTYWQGAISSFGVEMAKRGYVVHTNTTPITYGNPGNLYDLANYDVFIVPEPNTLFSSAEAAAILAFVQNGGGLVAISAHSGSDRNADGYDSPMIWNALDPAHLLGVHFGVAGDANNNITQTSTNVNPSATDSVTHGLAGVVTGVAFHNGTTLTLYPSANPTVRGEVWMNGTPQSSTTGVMAASASYGFGRVFFIGDESPVDDGSATPGNSSIFNGWSEAGATDSTLFLNAAQWVTRRPNSSPRDLVVSNNMTIAQDSTFNSVTVQNGGTLTVHGTLSVLTNMTVLAGGMVTHAARDTAGLRLNVGGTLTVASGGLIDVSGQGLLGGNRGAFGASGEALNAVGAIVSGAGGNNYGGGAGYGGLGGTSYNGAASNAAYGLVEDARRVGSGGGGSTYSGAAGGAGGGRVAITAATLLVYGNVLADGAVGASANGSGGGGSGGSIRLDVGTLNGTGTIAARGGAAGDATFSGDGGGGRVAVTYTTMTLPAANVLANGGGTGIKASAGTIYLKDTAAGAADLVVDNANVVSAQATPLRMASTSLRSLALRGRGQMNLTSTDWPILTLAQPLAMTGNAALTLGAGVTLSVTNASGFDVNVQAGSILTLGAGSTLAADALRVNGGTLNIGAGLSFPVASDFELSGNGTVNVLGGQTLSLAALDAGNVQSGTLNLATGSRLVVASDAIMIGSGVTLMKAGALGSSGDAITTLTVQSGGVVTHAARDTAGLRLNVGGTLTVASGGLIDVSGQGLLGGNRGAFGASGEALNAVGAIVSGAGGNNYGGGAGYGGLGGTSYNGAASNAAYGLVEDARRVGSGGGGSTYSGAAGGAGGGRVAITAATLLVYGNVLADGAVGASANGSGGGGSGGSIRLDVGTLNGTGTIAARGGAAGDATFSGDGGGGRVAVTYTTMTLPAANVLANGGGTGIKASAGTIYLKDTAAGAADLIVDNANVVSAQATPTLTSLPQLRDLSIRNTARLSLDATQRITSWIQSITLANATLSAPDTLRLLGTTLSGTGTVAARVANSGTISPGTLGTTQGQLVLTSDYVQSETGTVHTDVASAASYAKLRVAGAATLGGRLEYAYLNGYAPPGTARFPVLSHALRTGLFSSLAGSDSLTSLLYADTTTTLVPQNLAADHTPPDTQILTGPLAGSWTSAASVTFTWTGTDNVTAPANLRYAYRLDGGAYSAVSPATSVTYNSLAEGPHTFDVYGVDEAANADLTPASRSFTMDRTAPTVAFTSGPATGDTVRSEPLVFTLRGSDDLAPVSALKYSWSLDGAAYGAAVPDTTVSLSGLGNGPHTLAARAQDLAGNLGTPVTRSWVHLLGPRDLVVASAVTFTRDTTFNSVTVQNGGTLTADGAVTVLSNMTVSSGGVVTHAVRDTAGLRLNVAGTLTVASGGKLDVTGKGLMGGSHPSIPGYSVFGRVGETFDNSGAIIAGSSSEAGSVLGTGGGYGGLGGIVAGGTSNAAYGVVESPWRVGSGGSTPPNSGYAAGNGGGRMRIVAGSCVVDGQVLANGGVPVESPYGSAGGGSGGGIWLQVGSLSGVGQIQARGGNAGSYGGYAGGAGGGGRVAIEYGAMTMPVDSVMTSSGSLGVAGSAGTVYLKDGAQSAGAMVVSNGGLVSTQTTPLLTSLAQLKSVSVSNRGSVEVRSGAVVTGPTLAVFVLGNSSLAVTPGATFAPKQLRVNGSGAVVTDSTSLSFSLASDLEVSGTGTLRMRGGSVLSVPSFDATNVQSGTVDLGPGSRLDVAANAVTVGSGVTLVKDGATFGASDQIGTLTVATGGVVTHAVRDTAGLRLNVAGTLTVSSGGKIDVTGKGLMGGSHPSIPGYSVFGRVGETFDNSGAIIAGSSSEAGSVLGTGGGYGGLGGIVAGGTSNAAYGVVESPWRVGSGGSTPPNSGYAAGNGGGRMRIVAGSCVVDGQVLANGGVPVESPYGSAGGGSGGGIWLQVGSLSGVGQIQARGGNAGSYGGYAGGAGGGGRVAIEYGAMTMPVDSVMTSSGSLGVAGSAGTVYLKDGAQSAGAMVVSNGGLVSTQTTPLLTSLAQLKSVSVSNRGSVEVRSGAVVTGPTLAVFVLGNSSLAVTPGATFAPKQLRVNGSGAVVTDSTSLSFSLASDLEVSGTGTLRMRGGSVLSVPSFDATNVQSGTVDLGPGSRLDVAANAVTVGSGVTLVKDGATFGASDQIGTLTVATGGVVTHAVRDTAGLRLNVAGTLTVSSGGKIDVTGKGLMGGSHPSIPGYSVFGRVGETFDNSGAIIAGSSSEAGSVLGTGGGYGGLGGIVAGGTSNAAYGVVESPWRVGSGGSTPPNSGYAAGNGGGRMRIVAGSCVVDGQVLANGGVPVESPYGSAGGGSGGGIWLQVGSLSGVGQIQARGGNAGSYGGYAGGAGGGGRVAIEYGAMTMPVDSVMTSSGSLGVAGSAGTVYLKDGAQVYGDLVVDNANAVSSQVTPLLTTLAQLKSASVRNSARLALDATQRITSWTPTITLSNATLSAPDTLRLLGTTLSGTGTVAARVANSGTISPGTPGATPGQLVLASDYQQTETGTLHVDVASAASYSQLHVAGAATLGGHMDFAYLNGYAPPGTARFPILSHASRTGTFSSVTGSDPLASLAYADTTTTLVPQNLAADHTPPDTQILTGPLAGSWTSAASVSFTWTGTDNVTAPANLRYAYRLDGGAYSIVSPATSVTYGSIAEGPHTFDVYAVDEAANAGLTPASRSFTVDRTAPAVAFTGGPANGDTIGTDSTRFTFAGADDRASAGQLTYAWSRDGAAYMTAAAITSVALSALADGAHTFAVRAYDAAGNASTPVTRSFRVEATAPALATVTGPAEGAHVGTTSVTFGWTAASTSTPVGQLVYRYALDATPSGAFTRDTSASFSALAAAAHVLRIESQDRWGHVGALARNFVVDTTPPNTSIASGPLAGWANTASVAFTWTGTDNASAVSALRYAYRVDGSAYSAVSSATGTTVPGLAEGPHTLDVYAVDEAGNADATPASLAFTVDLMAPVTQIMTGPADSSTIAVNSAVYGLSGSDNLTPLASLRYQWQVDGGSWSAELSSAPSALLNALADGTHRIAVRAVDLAGNVDTAPPARVLTSDALPPAVTLTAGPAANACQVADSATFAWSGADVVTPAARLVYSSTLDGGTPTAFDTTRTRTLSGLSEGTHTLVVQSRDLVNHLGNVSRTFTVDHSASVAFTPTTRLLDNSTVGVQCTGTDNTGITGFHVQVASDTAFAAVVLDTQLGSNGVASYAGTPGSSYYARSQAVDCAGNVSAWSGRSNSSTVANLADLVVTQVVVPTALTAMQVFPVTYTVKNQGIGSTNVPQWSDDIYLSPTTTYDVGTAQFLGRVANQRALGPNEAYTTTTNVTVPVGTSGNQYVLVLADNLNNVPESDGTNNLLASAVIPVTLGNYADLVVTQVVAPPTTLSGTAVTVRWTVTNQGTGRTNADTWWDTVMLSSDSLFDYTLVGGSQLRVLDTPLGQFQHVGALDPGQGYDVVASVTIPANVSGKRFVLATSDLYATAQGQNVSERGAVFENTNEVNWAAAESTVVALQPPSDLVAVSATAGSSAASGGTLAVSWTVHNGGFSATPAVSWEDRVWLSSDAYFGGDLYLGAFSHAGPLALDSSYTANVNVTIPRGISGDYTIFVQTDGGGAISEYREDNNVVQAAGPVQVTLSPWPNLRMVSGVLPDTVAAGGTAVVQWTGTNSGTGAAIGAWSDDVVLSQSATWPAAGTGTSMGGARQSRTLAVGEVYTAGMSFTVPTGWSGRWYAYARTDVNNEVYENTDEGDNVTPIGSVVVRQYPPVDLVVSALTVPASAAAGGTLAVSFTVTNQGQATTLGSSWGEEVWLSADTQLGAGDILLSSPGHGGSLAAGASYSRSYTPALANGFSGTYYVIVRSDWGGTTGDTNLGNNTMVSASPVVFTAVPPADLVVQGLSTPSSGTAGQPLRVTWSMKNQGAGMVPVGATWTTGVYLSADPYLDGSDVPLGTRPGPAGLAPGASDPESLDVSLPTWASGGYYVIVSADISNAVWESSDANNASAYPVSLTLAPPSDLVVTDVQVPPVAIPGQVVSVSFTLANIGANAAVGQMQNAVYASADGAFQATSDPLVGISTMNVNLAPGAAQRFTQRMQFASPLRVDLAGNVTGLLPPLNPGPYHAIVRTNIRANVRELDLGNNEGVSAATLQTTVDSLALEVPVVTALASGQAVFYRVRVPAGQDLSFTLSSSDTNATNEMFAAYGRTPSGNDYDYAGPPEFTDAPEVLVPGTVAGEYFVMVVARDLGSGPSSEQVRLTARTLPFQVTSVSPSRGGQGGMVTVRLRGAGFRSTSVTRLSRGSLPLVTGRLVKLTNSTDMLVRFDLSQVGEGAFDLEVLTESDLVNAPTAFVVEPATPAVVQISVAHADVVRRTATAMFVFSFTNPSNQDVPVLRARLLYPATSQLRRLETPAGLLRRSDRAPELFAPMTGDVAPLRRADGTDSLMAIDLVGSNLAPGETRTVTLGVSGFETSPYSARALAEALTLGTFLGEEVQRNETARAWLLANPAGVPTDVIAAAGDPLAFRDSALVRNLSGGGFLARADLEDYLVAHTGQLPVAGLPGSPGPAELLATLTGGACAVASAVPECVPDVAALTSALPACRVCVDASGIPVFERVGAGGLAQVPAPVALGYSVTKSADVRVVSPCDPNDMIGPAGYGDQHWVKGSEPLAYRVDFENLAAKARAPAQVVRVSVPLDAGLDLTTFRLGTLGFGSHTVDASSQSRTTYDDEPFFLDLGLYVHVTCSIDPPARRANWTLTSIDPATMLPPTNADVGFLPVNNTAGQGMGYVTYSIQSLAGLRSGTQVQAQASIQFNDMTPLATVAAVNRVDNGVPVSAVLSNLAVLDSTHVRVNWTSRDDSTGSGTAGVSLYMKKDAGAFQSVGDNLTTSQLQVPVSAGHNYAFYTLATDNAGNSEPAKAGPDASVIVPNVPLAVDSLRVPRVTMLHPAYPNPCRDLAMVRFDLARAGAVSVEVYDVQGRRVAHPLDGKRFVAGTHTLALTGLPRAAGVYFVRMRTDGYSAVRRLVMLK